MILVDANLLLYARHPGFPVHRIAHTWLDEQLNGHRRVGLPWPSLLAFLRLSINPRVFEAPLTAEQAWTQIREWLARPVVWTPGAGGAHEEILDRLVRGASLTARLVPDAHLAALAVEHGLELYTTDRGFARFPGLRWIDPLEASAS